MTRVTRDRIVQLYAEALETGERLTYQQVGDELGVSKQRVAQLVRSEGLDWPRLKQRTVLARQCPGCGEARSPGASQCRQCRKRDTYTRRRVCGCGAEKSRRAVRCQTCYLTEMMARWRCPTCGRGGRFGGGCIKCTNAA